MTELVLLGATGSTGRRVTALAVAAGLRPVLAGRDRRALDALAVPDDLEVRAGGLDALDHLVDGARVVVNSVGPYTRFGEAVVQAALHAGAHYVDFSGEPRWIHRLITRYDAPARAAGCALVGSVGLGVAADLAAARATAELQPERVAIAYRIVGMKPSAATIASTVEMFHGGAAVVEHGSVRFTAAGGRGPAGVLFPTPDPLLIAHSLPGVSCAAYMEVPALLAPATAAVGDSLRRPRAVGLARTLARSFDRLVPTATGGGGRARATVQASAAGRTITVAATVQDVYDISARAALRAVEQLLDGPAAVGAVRFSAIAGEPAAAADAAGVTLP